MPFAIKGLKHDIVPADADHVPKRLCIKFDAQCFAQAALSRPPLPSTVEAPLRRCFDHLAHQQMAELVAIVLATAHGATIGLTKSCGCAPCVADCLDVCTNCKRREVLTCNGHQLANLLGSLNVVAILSKVFAEAFVEKTVDVLAAAGFVECFTDDPLDFWPLLVLVWFDDG